MKKYTLSIPTFNRTNYLFESFEEVLNDDRIDDIVIYDDFSNDNIFEYIEKKIIDIKNSKIKLFRQEKNVGAFLNKKSSVEKAKNDYVILLDSDNKITKEYLNSIPEFLEENIIYIPEQGICESPHLNYQKYKNTSIDLEKFKYITEFGDKTSICMLNTGNYVINKNKYLEIIDFEKKLEFSFACDVYYFLYLWYKNNKKAQLFVVENLKYYHRMHNSTTQETSHYLKTFAQSENFLKQLKSKIHEL